MLNLLKKVELIWSAILDYVKDLKELNMKMKITMIGIVLVSIVFAVCSGCVAPNEMYINSNYKYGTIAIPLLKAYTERDEALLEIDRRSRIKSLDIWLEQITQAKQDLDALKK